MELWMKHFFVYFFMHFWCTFMHFVYDLFLTFSSRKMLLSSQNKVFRADSNYMKEIQVSWGSFVIVSDKKFHVQISLLNDMFIWSFLRVLLFLGPQAPAPPLPSFYVLRPTVQTTFSSLLCTTVTFSRPRIIKLTISRSYW